MTNLYTKLEHELIIQKEARRIVKDKVEELKPYRDAVTKANQSVRNINYRIRIEESKGNVKL